MKNGLFKDINENKYNNTKLTDYPIGAKVLFDDGEEWMVVKPGVRGGKIFMAPFNQIAKSRYISIAIEFDLNWLNSNVRGINESINETSVVKIPKLSNVDHTRIIKWLNNQFDSNKYDMKKSGSGFEIDIHKLSKIEQEDLMYYLKSQSYINESVNEGMTFGEIKDKFVENPYGIGANAVEFVEGKNGNSSMLIFRHDEKHRRDQIESRLKTLGISPKKMSKSTADKAYKYRYELILHENVLEETNEINEGRSQIKRKYGEHGAIRVNSEAPIRNSILEFVGKRFVTRDELDSHLTQLSEDRGKAVDQNAWFKRNERYFESFSNRGSEVWTLSKYGKRVLENIIKAKQEKQEKSMIKESIGLFKFNSVNESIDVKYWSDYNTDTSGQGKKEHEVKSKDFEDTFEDAVVYWNQEADGAENRIKGAQIQKIKKMAQEFFKKAGWISSNVIQAMIAQES